MKTIKWSLQLILIIISPRLLAAPNLSPFQSDGCTMFVDGTSENPHLWKSCCVEHDLDYWVAGSSSDMDSADLKLKSCVDKRAGKIWAALIYMGVRIGHYSPIKNRFHWGWAWTPKREVRKLNAEEKKVVIKKLKDVQLEDINSETFIKNRFP